jgi:hypothetical protein
MPAACQEEPSALVRFMGRLKLRVESLLVHSGRCTQRTRDGPFTASIYDLAIWRKSAFELLWNRPLKGEADMMLTGSATINRPPSLKIPFFLSALVFVLLICFAGRYGFHSDELYFLACAQHPSWGYVDLPPLLPWLTWAVIHTLGASLTATHLYPAVAAAATVLLTARLASELGGGQRAVITGAVLSAITPVGLAFGHILSTNALDMPLWTAAVLFLVRIEKTSNPHLWLSFGALAGVALMHKYSLAFYLTALMVGMLFSTWRRWFLNRWFWYGVAIAFEINLPNIVWQAQRKFPFLQLQSNINANHRNVILLPFEFFYAQAFLVNLLSFAFVLAGAVFLFTPPMKRFRALGWTFIAYMLLMYALHAKDYLVTPVYPAMLAAGAVGAERWLPNRWAGRAVTGYVIAACALSALMLPGVVPVLSIDAYARYNQMIMLHRIEAEYNTHSAIPDYYSNCFGWKERAEAVSRYFNTLPVEERHKTAIFGSFYGQAGAIDHFGTALGLPAAIGGHHSYWYWGSRGYTGESVIALDVDLEYLQHHCASVTLVADPKVQWASPGWQKPIYHCRNLDRNLTNNWDAYRHFD